MNRGLLSGLKAGTHLPSWMGGGDSTRDGQVLTADSTQPGGTFLSATPASVENTSNRLLVGEETFRRDGLPLGALSYAASNSSGTLYGTAFTARKTESVGNVRCLGRIAAAATPTLIRIGVYSVNTATNVLTLVGSTANDLTLFTANSTLYTRAITTPFTKVAGVRYAVCVLVVTAVAAPSLGGLAGGLELGLDPQIGVRLGSQADLPASFTSVASNVDNLYFVLTP